MRVFEGRSAHHLYREQLVAVLQAPIVAVRGKATHEILNAATVITEPWQHAHYVPGRKWNPWLALSEAIWILSGRQDIYPLLPYNKRIAQFSDDGHTLYGAYGWRIRSQIAPLLERLKADPHDRRALLSIWCKQDLDAETKDPPCNDLLMFKLRENRLHMTVINRSNDLHWGLYAVNIPTFGILFDYLAAQLEVNMGTQTHLSNSLHVYLGDPGMEQNWAITLRMMGHPFKQPLPDLLRPEPAFAEPSPHEMLMGSCSIVLSEEHQYEGPVPFFEFADDYLRAYREQGDVEFCRHADNWPDWIQAAQVYRHGDLMPHRVWES